MTKKELGKLSRADLLQMLIDQSTELQNWQSRCAIAETALANRELKIQKAGSIAEAALQVNGIFDIAQASAQQYLDNIKLLSERQESISAQLELDSQEKAELLLEETKKRCEKMETETKVACAEMTAKAQAQACWEETSKKLDEYCALHSGLRELLSFSILKND